MLSALSKGKKLERAKSLFEEALSYDRSWQREAYEDFQFRDGNQWPAEERDILEKEMRPCLTFNLTKSSIDLVMGMNEDNKKLFRASPVEPSDDFLAEVLNDLDSYISESADFSDEEDASLESAAICGRGYVAVDFVPDPNKFGDIKLHETAIPVHEVRFDPSARRPTLEDAGYICWDRWLTKQDFQLRYPQIARKKLDDLLASGKDVISAADTELPQSPVSESYYVDDDSDYEIPVNQDSDIYFDKGKNLIRVIHLEYWETYKRFFGFDPESDNFVEFTGIPLSQAKESYLEKYGEELVYETLMDKKVKWFQFIGDTILFDDDSPLPYAGFSIVPVFAYRDVSGRTANHFGLVRLIKDPQREVNKRWSQALNMLNQQVQPGLYAEIDSFVNQQQAEMALKEAGSIAWTNAGALSAGKIKERTIPQFPSAPMQMEQFSQNIIKKITGINPDLLGEDRGRQEAGVVIRLRQQQGVTLLKPLFRSFNKMKKEVFKRRLAIIMSYMSDEQMLKILGQGDRYKIDRESGIIIDKESNPQLQAPIRDVRNLEYNIIAEESPGNMTKRMLELTTFMEMKQAGFVVDPTVIIDKMELSASEKNHWINYIKGMEESQQKQQAELMETELGFKDREVRVDEQKNLIEFIVAMAKIDQMTNKDKLRLVTEFAKLNEETKTNLRTFITNMFNMVSDLEQSKIESLTKLLVSDKGGKGESKD